MSEWIEVTPETLPEYGQLVFVSSANRPTIVVELGRAPDLWLHKMVDRWFGPKGQYELERFTHWMPANIPAPPEVK